jgi:hypothetical protein
MDERQLLREAAIEPTDALIAVGLGKANAAYRLFIEHVTACDIQIDWRYYRDGKAWLGKALYKWTTARGTQKERTVFWLSIWEGFFKVSLTFPERTRAQVMALTLSGETKQRISDAAPIGKMKIFPLVFDVCSDALFDDISALIHFKKMLK